MKQYWANAVGKLSGCGNVSRLYTGDSALSVEKAKEAVSVWQQMGDVYHAWIEDENGVVVWHECFVDSLGQMKKGR